MANETSYHGGQGFGLLGTPEHSQGSIQQVLDMSHPETHHSSEVKRQRARHRIYLRLHLNLPACII